MLDHKREACGDLFNFARDQSSQPASSVSDDERLLLYRDDFGDAHFSWVRPERRDAQGNPLVRDPIEPRCVWWVSKYILDELGVWRHTTHPRVFICTRAVALRDYADCVAEHDERITSGIDAEWRAAAAAVAEHRAGPSRYGKRSPEIDAVLATLRRLDLQRNCKTWSTLRVGASRWYWLARYPYRSRLIDGEINLDAQIIDEGFTGSAAEANAAAEAAARAAPGFVEPLDYPDGGGNNEIRRRYRRLHARRPKPSATTDTRPEGALGYLYERDCMRDSGWRPYPITKITAKRVFVRRGDESQRSFDRAKLERDGRVFWNNGTGSSFFYTETGKARAEAAAAQRTEAQHAGQFPLLALRPGFTRRDVLHAFRQRAHDLHPDHDGGDVVLFRQLVEEKNRALQGAYQ